MDVGQEMTKRGDVRIYDSLDDLSTDLADYVAEISEVSVKERGFFAVALSGGSLIRLMGKLTEAHYQRTVDWAKWHIFWVDERVVEKTHQDSNYKSAKDILLSKVLVVSSHVYSINDTLSAEQAAEEYGFTLRQLVKTRVVDVLESSDCPKFDLILLGMGPDGHTGSLFPGHSAVHERDEWVTFVTDSPKPPPERITFTLPVINSAAHVVMVVTGGNKAGAVRLAMEEIPEHVVPARLVSPSNGDLVWFLDREAASDLSPCQTTEGL